VGKKAILEMLPLQPGDVPDTSADVTALVAAIGYKPSTSIQVGVNAFVDWYRQYHGL
jgi:UDP-glucuronate 4-epimerase